MDEIQQFKCLTDLREVISQLDGYYAGKRGQIYFRGNGIRSCI